MKIRTASWLGAALLAATAAPAFAQDEYDPGLPPPLPELEDIEDYPDQDYDYADEGYSEEPQAEATPYPPQGAAPRALPPGYAGYRDQWLAQCRATYYDESGRRRGQATGAAVGAVAGGIAGHVIADEDDEFGGTLVGAGVGAIAGAAIGGEIGAESDLYRNDICADYLVQYEQGLAAYEWADAPAGSTYPALWVRVVSRCGCRPSEEIVQEIVEQAPRPAPRAAPVARDKRVRLRPVK